MADIGLSHAAVLSPLGNSLEEHILALTENRHGLSRNHRFASSIAAPLGEINWSRLGVEDPASRSADDLLWIGSQSVMQDLLPHLTTDPQRVGLFVGTTTCGVSGFYAMNRERKNSGVAVQKLLNPDMQQAFVAHRLAEKFGITGPVYTFSTSCVASTQAFLMAYDAVAMSWVDSAIVLGVDVLNLTTLHGFNSLQLLDEDFCKPFTDSRKGINLGEAIVGLLIQRSPSMLRIKGRAALSEAHHMTQPAPGGIWMKACMEEALASAKVSISELDYINPHATGTLMNDEAEMKAVLSLFGDLDLCDPTKRLSGHALGASGALEILLTALEMKRKNFRFALKNSFGFGGANLSLVLERGEA